MVGGFKMTQIEKATRRQSAALILLLALGMVGVFILAILPAAEWSRR
jgi:hypothetical protein